MSTKTQDLVFETVYHAAQAKGAMAAQACCPTPMVVQEHENPLTDSSPVTKQRYVPQGVCGFAWVIVRPGTSAFARWLVKHGYAKPAYYGGGVQIWIGAYGQCYEKKVAHARAMAEHLRKVGIKAYSQDRLD